MGDSSGCRRNFNEIELAKLVIFRVDSTRWLFSTEELLDELLDVGNTSGASNENYLVNILLLQISTLEDLKIEDD